MLHIQPILSISGSAAGAPGSGAGVVVSAGDEVGADDVVFSGADDAVFVALGVPSAGALVSASVLPHAINGTHSSSARTRAVTFFMFFILSFLFIGH